MQNIFIIALVVSIIFFILKFIEMRWVDKESKPLKVIVKETIVVYFSVLSGIFVLNQLQQVIDVGNVPQKPLVFTTEPNF